MTLSTEHPIDAYLAESPLIDWSHPAIRAKAEELRADRDVPDFVRRAYEFVRDEIAHSWDLQSRRITSRASEVLEHREGICYAKSHLLAALLRAERVPCGLSYQKLVLFENPADGYSLHALNTVYLDEIGRWIRLDARGNKPGVDAQFSLDIEQLAFPIRPELGEIDYPSNLPAPPAAIVDTLLAHTDCLEMYARGLPSDLTD